MGVERLDLYLGVERPLADIQREYRKLKQYLLKSHIRYDENILYTIDSMLSEYEIDCHNIRNLLRNLIV
jgi:hypothetical protein